MVRVADDVLQEIIDNEGCRAGQTTPISSTGIVRLALDLQDARRGKPKPHSQVSNAYYGLQNVKTGKLLDVNGGFRDNPRDANFALWETRELAAAGLADELSEKPRTQLRVVKVRTTWTTEVEE